MNIIKFNAGIFSIEINSGNFKLLSLLVFLLFILIDMLTFSKFNSLGDTRWLIYFLFIACEIIFLALLISTGISIRRIISAEDYKIVKNLRKTRRKREQEECQMKSDPPGTIESQKGLRAIMFPIEDHFMTGDFAMHKFREKYKKGNRYDYCGHIVTLVGYEGRTDAVWVQWFDKDEKECRKLILRQDTTILAPLC